MYWRTSGPQPLIFRAISEGHRRQCRNDGYRLLVALIGVRISLSAYALPMIFVGALMKLLGGGRIAAAGGLLAGFALVLYGLTTLQQGMGELAQSVRRPDLPAVLGAPGVGWIVGSVGLMTLIVVGLAMTAVMQSSTAAIAVTISAFYAGSISLGAGRGVDHRPEYRYGRIDLRWRPSVLARPRAARRYPQRLALPGTTEARVAARWPRCRSSSFLAALSAPASASATSDETLQLMGGARALSVGFRGDRGATACVARMACMHCHSA
jgi:hypothetical protein